MGCKRFRKYVGAFADGELDIEKNLDALEHLNMCPSCAARVAGVSTLRESLRRAYGNVEAPPRLKEKIEAMMRESDRTGATRPVRTRRGLRVFVPLAAVASLLLIVGLWRPWVATPSPLLRVADLPAQLVADARQQHRTCVRKRSMTHFDPTLPRDRESAATALGQKLGFKIVVPDLKHAGYRLIGMDRCGIGWRKGSHALYVSSRLGGKLSLFTIGQATALASDRVGAVVKNHRVTPADKRIAVVGWHEGSQTYLACAEMPEEDLCRIVTSLRIEIDREKRTSHAVLAIIK